MKYSIALILVAAFSAFAFSKTKPNHTVRCVSTMDSTTRPLIVVDGKALPSFIKSKKDTTVLVDALSEINPNDIEKVNVLKDENATAVYGEQGRNGVIEITLKRKTN